MAHPLRVEECSQYKNSFFSMTRNEPPPEVIARYTQDVENFLAGNGLTSALATPILSSLQRMHARYRDNFSGRVATYIPELAKADPGLFGIALVTADGQIYEVGDSRCRLTAGSWSPGSKRRRR